MRKIVALAALLCAAPLVAALQMPPARWQGTGEMILRVVAEADIAAACAPLKPSPGNRIVACKGTAADGRPVITIPDPCPLAEHEWTARVLCHEVAHATTFWNHETE